MVLPDLLGAAEEDAGLARLDHSEVVVAVPGGDGLEADALQGLHRGQLALLHADAVVVDHPVFPDLQLVAEDRRPAELLHQGRSELREGIGEDERLGLAAQGVQELLRAGHGIDRGDRGLDVLQAQAMLPQDAEAPLHQLVIVRLVPCGALQLRDAAGLGKSDPDLRNQDAFKIQTYNIHRFFGGLSARDRTLIPSRAARQRPLTSFGYNVFTNISQPKKRRQAKIPAEAGIRRVIRVRQE